MNLIRVILLIYCLLWLGGYTADNFLTLEVCSYWKKVPNGRRESETDVGDSTVIFFKGRLMAKALLILISVAASPVQLLIFLSWICKGEGAAHISSWVWMWRLTLHAMHSQSYPLKLSSVLRTKGAGLDSTWLSWEALYFPLLLCSLISQSTSSHWKAGSNSRKLIIT